ncbi:MAG: FAD-binding oxidoreductase [Bacteroidota bacterium]
MKYDTIIVGAGMAGACAALHLSKHQEVLLIEASHPGAGASGVAGGLFNPFIAYRGRPVWRFEEAIASFHAQLELGNATHLFDNRGLLRPARDEQQATYYQQSIKMHPNCAAWWSPEESKARHPKIHAPFGTMFVSAGGALSTAAFSQHMVDAAIANGVTYLNNTPVNKWGITDGETWVSLATTQEQIKTDRLVLALGYGYVDTPLDLLDLHPVKGQTMRINWPAWISRDELLPTSGHAYIIPEEETLAIGSSFEHDFKHEDISSEVTQDLLQKADAVLPGLLDADIVEEQVGFRVTVPHIRLPMVGPIDYGKRIWVFTAFGSKGLLLAPLLASELHGYFKQPDLIPEEIQIRVKT